MEDFEEQRLSSLYGDQKVQEMVMIKYKKLRADGFVESLEDIYTKQPMARIHKDNYSFTFDLLKNSIEDKMTTQSKILRMYLLFHQDSKKKRSTYPPSNSRTSKKLPLTMKQISILKDSSRAFPSSSPSFICAIRVTINGKN